MKNYNHNYSVLLTDLYELTMLQGYYFEKKDLNVVFDMFFRRAPFNGGYSVFAGLEPLVHFIKNIRFTENDIDYLKSLNLFRPEFLDYLKNFRFTGDLYAVEEGTIVFPNEPLLRIHSSAMEAQLLESILLNIINFQTLIATKTARIVTAAQGRSVLEFGLRRAQGIDGAISASRASYIGGADATSNVYAGRAFNIPVQGTMAHSWIMAFSTELEAFEKYASLYPDSTVILIDTYDTLNSGLINATRILKKLKKTGVSHFGIRLDSGDLEYLSKEVRKNLDANGLEECRIIVSNELDEYIIEQLVTNNAPIDSFGVGTHLVTAYPDSALSGVYKIVAVKENGQYIPKLKISNDPQKTTHPHIKNIYRLFGEDKMVADLIHLEQERSDILKTIKQLKPLKLFHPDYEYQSVTIDHYNHAEILLKKIMQQGKIIYPFPSLVQIREKVKLELKKLDSTYKRLLNPHVYKVSLTHKLRQLKNNMILNLNK